jgi:hypothetical protein
MSDLSRYLPKESETVKRIYEFHERMNTDQGPHHGRLGASIIGQPCERKLWYSFRQLAKRQVAGRLLRLFETGHLEEPRFIRELRGIGCTVIEKDATTGQQFEFTALGGHFVCHPDAVAIGIPEAPKTWHICEFKTMGGTETESSKDFEKVSKEGVQKAKPEHYAQMMCGMGLAELDRALYLAKKKATDELYGERVRYDVSVFKGLMDRAERIIRSTNPLERCAQRSDDFRCRFCEYAELCWGTGPVAVPLPCKTCRSCCHATPELDDGETWARWSCAKHKLDLDLDDQKTGCSAHLLLPGLVIFADVTDAGDDWIEFQNHSDGAHWRHGVGKGAWTTEELISTPGPLVGEEHVEAIKTAFNGTVASHEGFEVPELTLIEKYDPKDARLLWEGDPSDESVNDKLRELTMIPGGESLSCAITETYDGGNICADEFLNRYCLVTWYEENYAAIFEGVE